MSYYHSDQHFDNLTLAGPRGALRTICVDGAEELCAKSGSVSPRSGRMIVAQQFTAGMRSGRIVVREADGWNGSRQIDAVFSRPLKRGLGRNTFCAKLRREGKTYAGISRRFSPNDQRGFRATTQDFRGAKSTSQSRR